MIFFGILCVIVSSVACLFLFSLAYGLGMERITSRDLHLSETKEFIWKASDNALFLFAIPWLPEWAAFVLQILFYAALLFFPIYVCIKKIFRTTRWT